MGVAGLRLPWSFQGTVKNTANIHSSWNQAIATILPEIKPPQQIPNIAVSWIRKKLNPASAKELKGIKTSGGSMSFSSLVADENSVCIEEVVFLPIRTQHSGTKSWRRLGWNRGQYKTKYNKRTIQYNPSKRLEICVVFGVLFFAFNKFSVCEHWAFSGDG